MLVEKPKEWSHFSNLCMVERKTLKQITGKGVNMYGLFILFINVI